MNARLLAFDTSTEAIAVAVQADAGALLWNGAGGAAASSLLLPRIFALLDEAGLPLRQMHAVAYGRGPGAFTGLRTACAVAQGLAFGAALPVVPIDSLMLVAEGVRIEHGPRCGGRDDAQVDVAMDARMGEIYAASYRFDGAAWLVSRAPALLTPAQLNAAWAAAPPRCVAGSALAVFGAALRCGDAERIEEDIDRAAALLRLAQQRWRDAGGVDAAQALPLYLRDKVALTEAERAAQVAAP